MDKNTLTQSRLKEVLHYNPDTGIFTWIQSVNTKIKKSGIAGTTTDQGYIRIGIDRKLYRAHRLAFLYMDGYLPKIGIDHIDRKRNNNKWDNLRTVSHKVNCRNRSLLQSNKTGIAGVRLTGWTAYINNKTLYSGVDFFEACCARKSAENKLTDPD